MARREEEDAERGDRLLLTFEGLLADATRLRRKAEAAKNYGVAVNAIKAICGLLELAAAHSNAAKRTEEKRSLADSTIEISFDVENRVHVAVGGREASPSTQEDTPEAAEDEGHTYPQPDRPSPGGAAIPQAAAPPKAAPPPPKRPEEPPPGRREHVCGPKCDEFTCSVKNDKRDDDDRNDKSGWGVF